jgi:hypothetical protein
LLRSGPRLGLLSSYVFISRYVTLLSLKTLLGGMNRLPCLQEPQSDYASMCPASHEISPSLYVHTQVKSSPGLQAFCRTVQDSLITSARASLRWSVRIGDQAMYCIHLLEVRLVQLWNMSHSQECQEYHIHRASVPHSIGFTLNPSSSSCLWLQPHASCIQSPLCCPALGPLDCTSIPLQAGELMLLQIVLNGIPGIEDGDKVLSEVM